MFQENQIQDLAYYLTKIFMQCILKEYFGTEQLEQIIKHLDFKTQEQQIYFLTQLTVLLRKYPDSIFSTPDVRTNFINVVQECLDARILEENN